MQKEFLIRHGLVVGNNELHVSNNKIGINTSSSNVSLHIAANDGIQLPVGNTGQRPSNSAGLIRYNSDTSQLEMFDSSWNSFVKSSVNVLTGGIAAGGGALTANITITVPEANTSQYLQANADLAIAPDVMWATANLVPLVDQANIAIDFATGYNFLAALGGNRNLDDPSNVKIGQCGIIFIKQDATGSRTLSYSSNWKFAGGEAPTLTTNANATDVLSYFVVNSTFIFATLSNDVK